MQKKYIDIQENAIARYKEAFAKASQTKNVSELYEKFRNQLEKFKSTSANRMKLALQLFASTVSSIDPDYKQLSATIEESAIKSLEAGMLNAVHIWERGIDDCWSSASRRFM